MKILTKLICVLFLSVVLCIAGFPALAEEWPYRERGKGELEGTITLWTWAVGLPAYWDTPLKNSGFFKDYPKVKVRYQTLGVEDIRDRILVATIAGSGLPTMARIFNTFYPGFVEKGILQDLTSRFAPLKDKFLPITWESAVINNRVYGVFDLVDTLGMLYRRDILEKAGFPSNPDKVNDLWPTWDEFIEVGKKIKKATGADMMCFGPNTIELDWGGIWNLVSTGFFDKEGNLLLDSPELIRVAETIKKVWNAGIVSEYLRFSPQWFQAHKEGKFATLRAPSWMTSHLSASIPETEGLWGLTKLPAFYKGGRRGAIEKANALVICKDASAEEKEIAWRVIKYAVGTVEGATEFMKGWLGNLYTYIPAIEAIKDVGFPLLGGQKQYELFLEMMREEDVLPMYCPLGAERAGEFWENSMYRILTEDVDVEQVLQKAAEQLRKEMGR